jgi:choline-glycine betaine transporter
MTNAQFAWLIATILGSAFSIGFGIAKLADGLRAIHAQLQVMPNIVANLEAIRIQTKGLEARGRIGQSPP